MASRTRNFFNRWRVPSLSAQRISVPRCRMFRDAGLHAVAQLVDITPPWGVDLGGVGPQAGGYAERSLGRLFANVVLLDDGDGGRILLIACDLHSGSRYIAEHLAERLARQYPELGLGLSDVWMMASHTHSGPGHLYGEMFYDYLASKQGGLDLTTSEYIVTKLAKTVAQWRHPAQFHPAKIGQGTSTLWGWLWNRSHLAHLANRYDGAEDRVLDEALSNPLSKEERNYGRSTGQRIAHQSAPGEVELARCSVDPRLQVLHIAHRDGRPLATVGIMHATPSLLPAGARCLSGDVTALAAMSYRRRLERPGYPVAIVGGAMGDVNFVDKSQSIASLRVQRGDREPLGPHALRELHRMTIRAADALSEALERAVASSDPQERAPIQTRLGEWDLIEAPLNDGARHLAREHAIGKASLAGSELSRSPEWDTKHRLFGFRESSFIRWQARAGGANLPIIQKLELGWSTSRRTKDHTPKKFKVTQNIANFVGGVIGKPSKSMFTIAHLIQLKSARIGSLSLIAWPVEPSIGLSEQLQKRLMGGASGDLILCGLVNGFQGYATTEMEYRVQDYEGSSCLWGRHFGEWLVERSEELLSGKPVPPLRAHAEFATDTVTTEKGIPRFGRDTRTVWGSRGKAPSGPLFHHPKASAVLKEPPSGALLAIYDEANQRLKGSWQSRDVQDGSGFGNIGETDWVLRLLRNGEVVRIHGIELSDKHFPFLLRRRVAARVPYVEWSFELDTSVLPSSDFNGLSFEVTSQKPFRR